MTVSQAGVASWQVLGIGEIGTWPRTSHNKLHQWDSGKHFAADEWGRKSDIVRLPHFRKGQCLGVGRAFGPGARTQATISAEGFLGNADNGGKGHIFPRKEQPVQKAIK